MTFNLFDDWSAKKPAKSYPTQLLEGLMSTAAIGSRGGA